MEAMNRHFALVGPKLAEKITSKPDDDCLCYITPESNVVAFKTINETYIYIYNAIRKLKNGKAAGPVKILATIFKDVGDLITKPLKTIFYSSLTNGVFPDSWKIARITLTFKSGARKMSITIGPVQSSQFSQGSWKE